MNTQCIFHFKQAAPTKLARFHNSIIHQQNISQNSKICKYQKLFLQKAVFLYTYTWQHKVITSNLYNSIHYVLTSIFWLFYINKFYAKKAPSCSFLIPIFHRNIGEWNNIWLKIQNFAKEVNCFFQHIKILKQIINLYSS